MQKTFAPLRVGIATMTCLVALASAARAQPADPIADLLAQGARPSQAAEPAAPRPLGAPSSPALPWNQPETLPPRRDAPVHIEEDATPEGPPSTRDLSYDARLRASFASAQGLQGPLDGRWRLVGAGQTLYELVLVDSRSGALDGAWRDPRRPGAPGATGFLTEIVREPKGLRIGFAPFPDRPPVSLELSTVDGRSWRGELREAGRPLAVDMVR